MKTAEMFGLCMIDIYILRNDDEHILDNKAKISYNNLGNQETRKQRILNKSLLTCI